MGGWQIENQTEIGWGSKRLKVSPNLFRTLDQVLKATLKHPTRTNNNQTTPRPLLEAPCPMFVLS